MEWKLFEGDVPHVSTYEFHEHRARAPHLEQAVHSGRLQRAAALTRDAAAKWRDPFDYLTVRVVDLGCGDGGLISLIQNDELMRVFGYDFQPSNYAGWEERGLVHHTQALNFVERWDDVEDAEVYVITECLEHLADPHEMVRRIRGRGAHIVASSPWTETDRSHDECHAWAWDPDGYAKMITDARYEILKHEREGMFQLVWAVPA